MKNVLVTGSSGYLASNLIRLLNDKPEIEKIVGIDIKEPISRLDRMVFLKKDIREPLADVLKDHGIDTIFHLAFVKIQTHNKPMMEDINMNGMRNILSSALAANILQIIYTSSATAYGFYPDNDHPLTENSPIRGNDDYIYTKNKKEIELLLKEFKEQHPSPAVSIVRPVYVVGKNFDDPLSRHLMEKLCLIPKEACEMQFVHEDDMINIFYLLGSKRIGGAFNVGSSGTLTMREMVELLGNKPVVLPFKLMYHFNSLAWLLHLTFITESPSPGILGLRYPWMVSSEKLITETGYQYQYTSREAYMDWVNHIKGKTHAKKL